MSSPPRANSLGFKRRCRTAVVRSLALATTAAAALLFVQPSSGTPAPVTQLDAAPVAVTNRQIAVPEAPMGWASWNAFAAKVDYNVIKKQVDAFVAAGLPEAYYDYINIDEGWWQGTRDSAGNITIDEAEWPGGMKAIADYIHSKGLKAGIYTDSRQGRLRLLLPHRPPGRARQWQRGPLRAGHDAVLPVGLRLREGRLVRR